MKKLFLLPVTFLLLSCGGGVDPTDIFKAKEVLTKNIWYESCNNSTTKTHYFTNNQYRLTTYSDDNFQNQYSVKIYTILSYDEAGFRMQDGNITYQCITAGGGVNNDINTIIVDCVSEGNETKFKLFMGDKTKEAAKDSIHECFNL